MMQFWVTSDERLKSYRHLNLVRSKIFVDTVARQQIRIESSPDLGICSPTRGQENYAILVHF